MMNKYCEMAKYAIKTFLSKIYDFSIQGKIGKYKLKMPISHALPFYQKIFPLYSQNLGRVAQLIFKKNSTLKCIDIGANIGDSVAIIKNYCQIPVLGIEGEGFFLKYFYKNKLILGEDVEIEPCFVGDESGFNVEIKSGTARLIKNDKVDSMFTNVYSLKNIIKKHPKFEKFGLLKIDTDGFDTKIIKSSLDILDKEKPVIFFEYDPHFLGLQGEKGYDVFKLLENIGYLYVIIRDNYGNYITSTQIDSKILLDLHNYLLSRGEGFYYDIAVFASEQLFFFVDDSERKFFEKLNTH